MFEREREKLTELLCFLLEIFSWHVLFMDVVKNYSLLLSSCCFAQPQAAIEGGYFVQKGAFKDTRLFNMTGFIFGTSHHIITTIISGIRKKSKPHRCVGLWEKFEIYEAWKIFVWERTSISPDHSKQSALPGLTSHSARWWVIREGLPLSETVRTEGSFSYTKANQRR